jgi:hypothetical protein
MKGTNGQPDGTNSKSKPGLLWSKDPGSRFPFTEIHRACSRFPNRVEFKGWIPTRVYIHPDHADLLENPPPNYEPPEGILIVPDDKVALFYIMVKGEPEGDVGKGETFDDGEDDPEYPG